MSQNRWVSLIILAFFALGGLFFYQNSQYNDGKLHLVVCNVGQGDAIYIKTPTNQDILIDGGPDDSVLNCLTNHMPFWDRTLELVILTHPHADHLTGLISVLKRYEVMQYATENGQNSSILSKKLQDILAVKNLSATLLTNPDEFVEKDGLVLKTLWPTKEMVFKENTDLDVNGFSLIELLSYGNFKILLTGDAGVVAENMIAQQAGEVTVLKVPHHGSKTGMDQSFLSQLNPKLAIISVGEGNRYGHPASSALKLLQDNLVKTLRTDKNGEVEVVTDGKTWYYQAQR